jgi:hypothetical protein
VEPNPSQERCGYAVAPGWMNEWMDDHGVFDNWAETHELVDGMLFALFN